MEANASKPQDKKDVLELFQMYLSLHNAYHDHKELMAYSATALYLGGISTLLLSGREFWVDRTILYIGVLILFTIFACLLTFFFVRWQFRQRCFAATIMAACVNLTNKWLPTPTVVADLTPVPFGVSEEFHVPPTADLWGCNPLDAIGCLHHSCHMAPSAMLSLKVISIQPIRAFRYYKQTNPRSSFPAALE